MLDGSARPARLYGARAASMYGGIYRVLPDSGVRVLSARHWLRAINANTIGCADG